MMGDLGEVEYQLTRAENKVILNRNTVFQIRSNKCISSRIWLEVRDRALKIAILNEDGL